MNRTSTLIYAAMLGDVGRFDTSWNYGYAPVHLTAFGPSKSISVESGMILKNFADALDAENIVEIGTFKGYSTSWLMLSCLQREKGHVMTFDIEKEGYYGTQFYDEYKIPRDLLTYIQSPVWEASGLLPDTIDFCFHDSDHEVDPLLKELATVVPVIRHGGMIVFDDVLVPGYITFANTLAQYFFALKREWTYKVLPLGHGFGIAQKKG